LEAKIALLTQLLKRKDTTWYRMKQAFAALLLNKEDVA